MKPAVIIFRKTLSRGRVSLLSFAVGIALFEFITVVTFPSIGGTSTVRTVFESLGPDMQRLLKIAPNLQVGFGPRNYLAFGYFHPVFLGLGSAFVVSRASDAVAGDIERGTILFTLSRPLSRGSLLLGKTAELVLSLFLVVAGAVLGTYSGLALVNLSEPVPMLPFIYIGLNAYMLFLALGGVALILSALSNSAAQVAGLATGFALLAFTADFLSSIPVVSILGFISPFRFYDPQSIMAAEEIPLLSLLVLFGVAGIGFCVALFLFERRDIAA